MHSSDVYCSRLIGTGSCIPQPCLLFPNTRIRLMTLGLFYRLRLYWLLLRPLLTNFLRLLTIWASLNGKALKWMFLGGTLPCLLASIDPLSQGPFYLPSQYPIGGGLSPTGPGYDPCCFGMPGTGIDSTRGQSRNLMLMHPSYVLVHGSDYWAFNQRPHGLL